MDAASLDQLRQTLRPFSDTTRLYALRLGAGQSTDWLVEAFAAEDGIQEIGVRTVIALSVDAHIALMSVLGQPARMAISLADGSRIWFSGFVHEASLLASDGGLARYGLRIAPWMWRLEQVRQCRVWENRTVIEIVDDVFRPYQPQAQWRWSSETPRYMEDARPRSYCCQYRESDLDFVRRLLTEEGLCWRFEENDAGACCVIFSNSTQVCAVPEDPCSVAGDGVRYHGARPGECTDTVQAMHSSGSMLPSVVTVLGTDYKARNSITASSPSRIRPGATSAVLEVFDNPGAYAFADAFQARRYADLHMEALEARSLTWQGSSTLRTLRAGSRLRIVGMPARRLGTAPAFMVIKVVSMGINNLPPQAQQALAELFGSTTDVLEEFHSTGMLAMMQAQARESGYANCFEAIPADRPWRAQLPDTPAGRHPRPTVHGAQTAIVVGGDGSTVSHGANERHCDRLGRVRIRFHWQEASASCWVRVAQRAAGGSGSQFLPRIGQEVLVQFMDNNIDRPVIVGALYNGQGEGGIYSTPGGAQGRPSQAELFTRAHDHARMAQGNLVGSNSPAWHGASRESSGHRNAAAQWGIRSREMGGNGYNQLLFDDTDAQGRVQLKCTSSATELNLGHLIHTADHYRGSFRGLGAELRTDAYGAVRAGAGLLISSYKVQHSAAARAPAGENPAGIAMLQQAAQLAVQFHAAALTHEAVGLAGHGGEPPLQSLRSALVSTGAGGHMAKPIIAIAAQGGLAAVAGQDLQVAAGDDIALTSAEDTQFAIGGQLRMHAGQAIGVLGGAIQPGAGGAGLQLIAAHDDTAFEAQSDALTVQARDDVSVVSASAHIDWAAARSISLSTVGGANITIDGGNITVQCSGKLTIHAGVKSFSGPGKLAYPLPIMPTSICVECLLKARAAGAPFVLR